MAKEQITIKENKIIYRDIEVIFPYYYIHRIYGDSYTHHIYGKIKGGIITTIQEKIYHVGEEHSFEIEENEWEGHGYYFTDEFESNEQDYNGAKKRLIIFLNRL